jgi:hypothetical protein
MRVTNKELFMSTKSQYLILIHGDEKAFAENPSTWEEMGKGHAEFGEKHAGSIAGGNALQGSDTATSIRPTAGGFTVTDGPFTETKEALGGYYLVDAADLDEAISIAKDLPMPHGGVEVRPIMVLG